MKKNILLIIFIGCNLWLCYVLISKKQDYHSKLNSFQAKSIDNYKDFITESFIKSIKYEDYSFQISNNARKEILRLFSEGNENKLFFRMSFPYCESCIFPVIDELEKNLNGSRRDDIVIITSFPNEEYAKDFKRVMKNKNLKVLNIPDIDFCLDINSFNGSYLFIMNANMHHKSLLFVNKFNLFLLGGYFSIINQTI